MSTRICTVSRVHKRYLLCTLDSIYVLQYKLLSELTAQKDRATGEKGPATEFELGAYVRSIVEFQQCKPLNLVEILCPQSPLSPQLSF